MEKQEPPYLDKARKICAMRETSKKELEEKLFKKGCPKEQIPEILEHLEREGALNDTRFAEAYVRDKLTRKGWGRIRIRRGLQENGIEEEALEKAMDELDEEEETRFMKRIIAKKWKEELAKGGEKAKEKAIAAAERKGHPLPKIMECIENASGPDSLDGIEP